MQRRGLSRSLQVNRRIALCWEPGATPPQLAHLNVILDRFPQGGVFILPISWLDVIETWNVGIGGAFVPYENSLQQSIRLKSAL
ncbi:hypothetical protein G3A56_25645 (plasmid) [Rhizobium oryzihabitans]|uniref:Uncharacterized protein n=1 Tax=Rhizobium oryzihabitans TaxID=2267833 RepID=A0A7L5BR27_9HYPH|nr:hypothetical protein [Rhizobium oryzihabitans]QIB41243.1 hypothetical protein G3A56_25645 [Rhizobium oryzihabitans]